jgi:hypothetical protein
MVAKRCNTYIQELPLDAAIEQMLIAASFTNRVYSAELKVKELEAEIEEVWADEVEVEVQQIEADIRPRYLDANVCVLK